MKDPAPDFRFEWTESHYLVFLPAKDRARAMRIPGARWDPTRGCAVLPRTPEVREALLREFSVELRHLRKERETQNAQAVAEVEPSDDHAPGDGDAGTVFGELLPLVDRLTAQERELHESRALSEQLEQQIAQLKLRISEVEAQLESERDRAATAARELDLEVSATLLFEAMFPNDRAVPGLASALVRGDPDLPFQLGRRIEVGLRGMLDTNVDMDFFQMINLAKEKGLLSTTRVDMAHLLRKRRNQQVHGAASGTPGSILANNLLCIAATRLLLPELKQVSD